MAGIPVEARDKEYLILIPRMTVGDGKPEMQVR
jgi:hypothetical protein